MMLKVGLCFLYAIAGLQFSARPLMAYVSDVWYKVDNTVPSASDGVSTNGRLGPGTLGAGDSGEINSVSVMIDGGIYRMWYSARSSLLDYYRIYYATSPDGFTWTKLNNSIPATCDSGGACPYGDGRLGLGTVGRGDAGGVSVPTVIKDGGTYKMWYSGYSGTWNVYYATSLDGLTWTKVDNADIPPGTPCDSGSPCPYGGGRLGVGSVGRGDDVRVHQPTVLLDGGVYRMWYFGEDGVGNGGIFHATSGDGLTWTKSDNSTFIVACDSGSPCPYGGGKLGSGSIGRLSDIVPSGPNVLKVGSKYRMWYSGYDGANTRIYHASSTDGLTWTKMNNYVPSLTDTYSTYGRLGLASSPLRGDSQDVHDPEVVYDGSKYQMLYIGAFSADSHYAYSALLDLTPPSVSLARYQPDPTSSSSVVLTGTATENVTYVEGVQWRLNTLVGSWSICSPSDGAFDQQSEGFWCNLSGLVDGTHTAYVRAYDHSGNFSSPVSDSFTVDTTPPYFSNLPGTVLQINLLEGQHIPEGVLALQVRPVDLTTRVASVSFFSNDQLICMVSVPSGFGVYSCDWDAQIGEALVRAVAVDQVGNRSELSRNVVVEAGSVDAPVFDEEPEYTRGTENTVIWTSSVSELEYYVENSVASDFGAPFASSGWIPDREYKFASLEDGQIYHYRVKARNAAEVESPWSEAIKSTQDASPPVTSVAGISERSGILTLAIDSYDLISGVNSIDLFAKKDNGSWSQFTSTTRSEVDYYTEGRGTYCFYSRGVDNVGNFEADDSAVDGAVCYSYQPAGVSVVINPIFVATKRILDLIQNAIEEGHVGVAVVGAIPAVVAALSLFSVLGLYPLDLPIYLRQAFLWLLEMLGRRSKRYPWGVVYNSLSKVPIARSVVRLFSGGVLLDTSVTDINGVFAFSPVPGKYTLRARYPGFLFPSQIVTLAADGAYANVYRGAEYNVSSEESTMKVSIPLDPIEISPARAFLKRLGDGLTGLIVRLNPFLLLAGIGLSSYAYAYSRSLIHLVFFFINLGLLVLHFSVIYLTKDRWGVVEYQDGKPASGLDIGLFERKYNRLVDSRVTDEKGRYQFVVPGDEYLIKVLSGGTVFADSRFAGGYPVGRKVGSNIRISEGLVVRGSGDVK